nr:MAG TPA: hypothetical protein [Caudoviricetes sp.]
MHNNIINKVYLHYLIIKFIYYLVTGNISNL